MPPFSPICGRLFPIIRLSPGTRVSTEFTHGFKYQLQEEDVSSLEDVLSAVDQGWEKYQTRRTRKLVRGKRKRDEDDDSEEDSTINVSEYTNTSSSSSSSSSL